VLSVGELDRRLKRAIEGAAVDAWVEGEIGSMRPSGSGHVYFVLKDESEDACIDCVMYRSSAIRAGRVLQDGARIRLRGRATLWAPRGRLQFVVDIARPAGRGALLEALEVLKKKLQDEGLFAPERKRPIPPEPRIIGVVTSASGAAIHDIVQVAFRRGGARILLAPASVQGAEAPSQIIAAMDRLERVPGVDVIVIGRGGGASDDLSAFNDEALTRRVAACKVPVVSAVGHEIDTTLTDLVADLRAATPSQAAEMLVPSAADRRQVLVEIHARLLSKVRGGLVDPRTILGDKRQAVDDLEMRLREVIRLRLVDRQRRITALDHRLSTHHPRTRLERVRGDLGALEVRLSSGIRERMLKLHESIAERAASLHALSPLAVLGRGYSIALRADGRAITRHSEVEPGEQITVRVHRGQLVATVEHTEEISGTGLTPKPPHVG
jgi:exodeoxyribonuclease VII large subunit